MNAKDNYSLEEAGMAQMDDSVGALLKHLEDIGEADNTIVHFHHRQWGGGVHLAGRRHDSLPSHQRHCIRRWLPRAGYYPMARACQA